MKPKEKFTDIERERLHLLEILKNAYLIYINLEKQKNNKRVEKRIIHNIKPDENQPSDFSAPLYQF